MRIKKRERVEKMFGSLKVRKHQQAGRQRQKPNVLFITFVKCTNSWNPQCLKHPEIPIYPVSPPPTTPGAIHDKTSPKQIYTFCRAEKKTGVFVKVARALGTWVPFCSYCVRLQIFKRLKVCNKILYRNKKQTHTHTHRREDSGEDQEASEGIVIMRLSNTFRVIFPEPEDKPGLQLPHVGKLSPYFKIYSRFIDGFSCCCSCY